MASGDLIKFQRQLNILSPDEMNKTITIIGAGGIGSFTADVLSKMGIDNINIFDEDIVEMHNAPNQRYAERDVGRAKVRALEDFVLQNAGIKIQGIAEKYINQPLSPIVISGVDSKQARREIWQTIRLNDDIKLYIDGRLGGEAFKIYALNPLDPDHIEKYEESLRGKGARLPCTAKSIIYVGYSIAAEIAFLIKKFLKGKRLPFLIFKEFT